MILLVKSNSHQIHDLKGEIWSLASTPHREFDALLKISALGHVLCLTQNLSQITFVCM